MKGCDLLLSDTRKKTNMVFGSTVIDGSTGEWLTLNEKVLIIDSYS